MPRSSPLFPGAAVLFSTSEREEERDARRVFLLSCISSCNLTRHLPFGHGPFVSSLPPPLFHPSFYTHPFSHTQTPILVAFCPPVASDSERGYTVISIRRNCLLICPPACQSAYSSTRLRACLPASVLPTAMPRSCPIHLLLNKRLLSSGHPSLCWPLFFVCQAQE